MSNHDLTEAWTRLHGARESAQSWWLSPRGKRANKILLSALIIVLLVYLLFLSAPADFPENDIVTVPHGASLTEIGEQLDQQHIIRSQIVFKGVVFLLGGARDVFAGDYLFNKPSSVFSVARRLTSGAYGLTPARIRIPEGATVEEMAIIFEKRLPRFDPERFVKEGKELEGYLFPDTYFFMPNATEDVVMRTMMNNFEEKFAEIEEEFVAFGKPLKEVVTMASLLEKESHDFEDKRGIAGVLWKRLEIEMPLQVDATFLYINGKSTFELTLDDLQGNESPYNTYKFKGLPPGPIANPGLDSLRAAVTPESHDFLFYLADNNGVTYFSETYAEHLRKKRLYLGT